MGLSCMQRSIICYQRRVIRSFKSLCKIEIVFDRINQENKKRVYNMVCSIRFFKFDDSKVVLMKNKLYQDQSEYYLMINERIDYISLQKLHSQKEHLIVRKKQYFLLERWMFCTLANDSLPMLILESNGRSIHYYNNN